MKTGKELFEIWQTSFKQLQKLDQRERELALNLQNNAAESAELRIQKTEQQNVIEEQVLLPLVKDYALGKSLNQSPQVTELEKIIGRSYSKKDDEFENFLKAAEVSDDEKQKIRQSRAAVREFFELLLLAEPLEGNYDNFYDYVQRPTNASKPVEERMCVAVEERRCVAAASQQLSFLLNNQLGIADKKRKILFDRINEKTGSLSELHDCLGNPINLDPKLRILGMGKALAMLDRDEKNASQQPAAKKLAYNLHLPRDPRDFTRAILLKEINGVECPLSGDTLATICSLLDLGWKDLLGQCEEISSKDRDPIKEAQPTKPNPIGYSVKQASEDSHRQRLKRVEWRESKIEKLRKLKERYSQYQEQFDTMIRANEWLNKLEKMKDFEEEDIPFAITENMNHWFRMYLDPLPRLYLHCKQIYDLYSLGETPIGMNSKQYVRMTKLAETKFSSKSSNIGKKDTKNVEWDDTAKKRIDTAVEQLKSKIGFHGSKFLANVAGDYRNCMDAFIESRFKDASREGPALPIITKCFPSDFETPPQTLEEQIEVLSRVMKEKILDLEQGKFDKLTQKDDVFSPRDSAVVTGDQQRHKYGKLLKENLTKLHDRGLRIWKRDKMEQYAQEAEPLRKALVDEFKEMNNGREPNEGEAEEIRRIALWQVMSQSEDMREYLEAHKITESAQLLSRYVPENQIYGVSIMGITEKEFDKRKIQLQTWIDNLSIQTQRLILQNPQFQLQVTQLRQQIGELQTRMANLPSGSKMQQVEELRKLQSDCCKLQTAVNNQYQCQCQLYQQMMQMQLMQQQKALTPNQSICFNILKKPEWYSKSKSIRRYYLAKKDIEKSKKGSHLVGNDTGTEQNVVPRPENPRIFSVAQYSVSQTISFTALSASGQNIAKTKVVKDKSVSDSQNKL